MHNALIFKEQVKVKGPELRENGLAQPHYSIQHIEGYDLLCYKDRKQDLHSSIIDKEYCPGTMNIYFILDRLEQKKTIRNTMTLCGSGGYIYNKDTSQNTLSACTQNDRSSNTRLAGLKLSKP
jgi:hypothetical protein